MTIEDWSHLTCEGYMVHKTRPYAQFRDCGTKNMVNNSYFYPTEHLPTNTVCRFISWTTLLSPFSLWAPIFLPMHHCYFQIHLGLINILFQDPLTPSFCGWLLCRWLTMSSQVNYNCCMKVEAAFSHLANQHLQTSLVYLSWPLFPPQKHSTGKCEPLLQIGGEVPGQQTSVKNEKSHSGLPLCQVDW